MIMPAAMRPNEVEDPSSEFDVGVQIVSRAPDQILNSNSTSATRVMAILGLGHRGGHRTAQTWVLPNGW